MATSDKRKLPSLAHIKNLIGDNYDRFFALVNGTTIYPDANQNNITAGTGGAIPITNFSTTINVDAGGDAYTLANGTVSGQRKKIRLLATAGGTAVITGVFSGGTTLTITAAGSFADLQWNGTAWRLIEGVGAVIS